MYKLINIVYYNYNHLRLAQLKAKRKAKKREKKEHENNVKKHYANVRVIQKNLVYVIGLPSYIANEEV